jgi:hemerythrin-like domain-containing protein
MKPVIMKKGKELRLKTVAKLQGLQPTTRKDPISMLTEEHKQALHYTVTLNNAADRIKRDGFSFDAYMEISDAIIYIETEIRLHDKKEEEILFPLLVKYLPEQTNALRFEHRELWSAMSQLRMIVKDVSEGNIHGSTIFELVKATRAVADLLKNHIHKEDTFVFPQVRKLLSKEEYQRLTNNLAEMS